MSSASRDGAPIWMHEGEAEVLERVPLHRSLEAGYDEAWLQELLFKHPSLFPATWIEPEFDPLISACRELGVTFGESRSGSLDNVFVTAAGRIVLVEAKLWRNPQARREVVAQALDYAAAVFRMSYSEFEAAILKARGGSASSLFAIARDHGDATDEAAFIDAVTRNLRRGRAIVAVVGDGLREDVLALADLLQSQVGSRFTFALVELGVFRSARGGLLVRPTILGQTTMIERAIIEFRDDRFSVVAPATQSLSQPAASRRVTLSEDEFMDALGAADANYPDLVRSLLEGAETLGVWPEMLSGMNLKRPSKNGKPYNLGVITKAGYIQTEAASWWAPKEVAEHYNQALARLIDGSVKSQGDGSVGLRDRRGKTPALRDLLPSHRGAWLAAMKLYIDAAETAEV